MCGIAGIFDRREIPVEAMVAATMGRSMHHRGPDNFSVVTDRNLGLAHNRLSILDLSPAGSQPFTDGRYSLIYNGEIYNYLQLKGQLQQWPIQFRSTSDTEVLFHYLVRFGIDRTLAAAKGMFAFAFFDRATQTLILARDRFGIKPLYWFQKHSVLYFGSEIKAIAAVTPLELDPVQVLFSFTGGAEALRAYSMFRGVKAVKPGTYITVTIDDEPAETTYYTLRDQVQQSYLDQLRRMRREEVNELFDELFQRSVDSMLMSDAPMGVFVSGGVDSSLAAVLARQRQPLSLFTSDVRGPDSELSDARLLAHMVNAPLHVSTFDPPAFVRDIAEATYHYEIPVVSFTNAVPFMNVAKLARQHGVKAVLTGEGADELFHGYPYLLTKKFDRMLRLPLDAVRALYSVSPKLASYVKVGRDLGQNDFLRLLVHNFQAHSNRQEFVNESKGLNGAQREDYFTTIGLCDAHLLGLLLRNDRMGMAGSIESRFPFLDEDVVKFGINLPGRFKRRMTWRMHNYKHPFIIDKAPVRNLAARWLPLQLAHKAKWGFSVNAHRLLKVRPGFFSRGFVGEICGLTPKGEAHLLERMPPYFVGKLVSIEVFGRIFSTNSSIDAVAESVSSFVAVDSRQRATPSAAALSYMVCAANFLEEAQAVAGF